MNNQNLISGRETLPTDVDQHIWLADKSKSSKSTQNNLWFVSQSEMFVLIRILYKKCFSVRWEKRSDVPTKDKGIRKKISPRNKASPAKASFFEKLNKIEKLHQPIPKLSISQTPFAQSAGAVEYTDCTSAEGQDPTPNECPGYDTKQSDGEVPAVLELWGMWSTPSLPLLPGPLWSEVVAPDRALSMG